jgi:hypothetical protein
MRVLVQRIEVRGEHAERAVLRDEAKHEHLLVHRGRVDHRALHAAVARELANDSTTGACETSAASPRSSSKYARQFASTPRDRRGSARKALDERRIRAEQRARAASSCMMPMTIPDVVIRVAPSASPSGRVAPV